MRCALQGVGMRYRVLYVWLALAVFGGQRVAAQQDAPRVPMKEVYADGAEARWLNKKVLESQLLDSMETQRHGRFTATERWRWRTLP